MATQEVVDCRWKPAVILRLVESIHLVEIFCVFGGQLPDVQPSVIVGKVAVHKDSSSTWIGAATVNVRMSEDDGSMVANPLGGASMSSQRPISQSEYLRQQRVMLMPQVEERFGFLKVICALLTLVGGIALISGVIGAVLSLAGGSTYFDPAIRQVVSRDPLLQAVLVGVGGVVLFLALYAMAEFLKVQIAQEENQRITNQLLYNLMARQQQ